ncbi:MAG: DUF4149 domain-containing protein [Chloroflexi bacterium]|nr:DUF4149 domain-containing protein [Chloroflexota bacterium]
MRVLYFLLVWLHILAAVAWIGGMVFLTVVLVPVLRRPEFQSVVASLFHRTGVRLRWAGWIALILLAISGLFNLVYRVGWSGIVNVQFWQTPFGTAFGIKLIPVAIILFLSIVHDFVIGPRSTALWMSKPFSPEALTMRRVTSWIGRVTLLLALVVVALAVVMTHGWP